MLLSKIYFEFLIIWCGVCLSFSVVIERKKTYYFAFERGNVTYFNKKYFTSVHLTSRRVSREDPVYYINVDIKYIKTLNADIQLDLYLLEFLTNQYKPSIVELHMRACYYLNNGLFKDILSEVLGGRTCPFIAPGEFQWQNITINSGNTVVLKNFPIQKGRIVFNYTSVSTGEHVAEGRLDYEIKEMKGKTIRKSKD